MLIEPQKGLLRNILGEPHVADNGTRRAKDGPVMERKRFIKLDTHFRCRRRSLLGHYVHKYFGTLAHFQHRKMLIDQNTPPTAEL
jgi:hypothetical protein